MTLEMKSLRVGHKSDVGRVRKENEDAYLALVSILHQGAESFPFGLLMVADGMGGQAGGKEASQLAIRMASWTVMAEKSLSAECADMRSIFNAKVRIKSSRVRGFLYQAG